MSRHRNIRKLNYDEECEIDDVYGRSVEDEHCISPNTAAEFMYDRNAQAHSFSHYLTGNDDILEENVDARELDRARLQSCLDEICNVVGDSIPEPVLREAIVKNNFDIEKSLDDVLSKTDNTEMSADFRTKDSNQNVRVTESSEKTGAEFSINLSLLSVMKQPKANVDENREPPTFSFLTNTSSQLRTTGITNPISKRSQTLDLPSMSLSFLNGVLPSEKNSSGPSLADLYAQSAPLLKNNTMARSRTENVIGDSKINLPFDLSHALKSKNKCENYVRINRDVENLSPVKSDGDSVSDMSETRMHMANSSLFGKIVCCKLKTAKVQTPCPGLLQTAIINHFDFVEPSPDDFVKRKRGGGTGC